MVKTDRFGYFSKTEVKTKYIGDHTKRVSYNTNLNGEYKISHVVCNVGNGVKLHYAITGMATQQLVAPLNEVSTYPPMRRYC